jgi:Transposase, Mutator family
VWRTQYVDGGCEVLGLDVGDNEDEVFWRGFPAALKTRGLIGVRLAISTSTPAASPPSSARAKARPINLPHPLRPQLVGARA